MQITLDNNLYEKLTTQAQKLGITQDKIVTNALISYFNMDDPEYDRWFRAQVEHGLLQAENNELISGEDMDNILDTWEKDIKARKGGL